jgi:predicted glycogen debranching enzyme
MTPDAEWLETDGLGGFASGTVSGVRTRRYHAVLTAATTPPTGRVALVQGFEAWIERDGARTALSSQYYAPDVRHPDGADRIRAFAPDPWPRWTYDVGDGARVEQELFVSRGAPVAVLVWRGRGRRRGLRGRLCVRPLVSGRDLHALHHENPAFRFDALREGGGIVWHPYAPLPAVAAASNGAYRHEPLWYRRFLYTAERARGLDCIEDLASPGEFAWDLASGEAILVLAARVGGAEPDPLVTGDVATWLRAARARERRRRCGYATRLDRAAEAYRVRRGAGETVIAGYPWFTDWGRDTFIALRGLCLATGRLAEARRILLAWAGTVSDGMLPNRFVEEGDAPEYNSVDAALWFVIAADALRQASRDAGRPLPQREWARLRGAITAILEGHAGGTRHGIRLDDDGLLATGAPGMALTWMDAKVGDRAVTPRVGKPVEVEALWLNALAIGAALDERWAEPLARGRRSFTARFWNAAGGCLYDVVDVDHRPGTVDATFRPNQIFAVGGLPRPLVDGTQAAQVVAAVESRLLTPLGLRSLAPGEPHYRAHYAGGVSERDAAYHQGTAWPWLLGAFVDAWLRVHGDSVASRKEARHRFLDPLMAHLDQAGLGHISEIADAEEPFTPRGCPFQAWSVGEALRLAARLRATGRSAAVP